MDNPGTSISISLTMAKAMSLARAGRIKEAQSLIAGERTIPDHPLALHALAALVTSEGDYLRALKLWELLLQRDPHHAEAKRMVDTIEMWISRPAWMKYWQLIAGSAAALVLAMMFWVFAFAEPEPIRLPPSSTTGSNNPVGLNAVPTASPGRNYNPTPVPMPPAPPVVTFPGVSSRKKSNGR